METLLTVFLFMLALALIILVLIQPDQSHGGPLAKATKVVAALFIIDALLLYLIK